MGWWKEAEQQRLGSGDALAEAVRAPFSLPLHTPRFLCCGKGEQDWRGTAGSSAPALWVLCRNVHSRSVLPGTNPKIPEWLRLDGTSGDDLLQPAAQQGHLGHLTQDTQAGAAYLQEGDPATPLGSEGLCRNHCQSKRQPQKLTLKR